MDATSDHAMAALHHNIDWFRLLFAYWRRKKEKELAVTILPIPRFYW